ncbi:hypothetical protein [Chryseobacterium aquaticum]|uniref:hypothetical protein n=1 Tax=Chryseobacterium aquaticum TaxID=452084 RepID=UPI003F6FEEFE
MGLTYHLRFKKVLPKKNELSILIKNNKNDVVLVSDLYTTKYGYVNGDFDGQMIDLNLGNTSYISFDVLNKESDSILRRKFVLNMVSKITKEIYPEEDYFFDLNGDFIFEKRENGVFKRNSNTDFYDGLN